jgi:hypothetical protein
MRKSFIEDRVLMKEVRLSLLLVKNMDLLEQYFFFLSF